MSPTLADEHTLPALYMVWSQDWMHVPDPVTVRTEYNIRLFQPGDEQWLSPLFQQEGWPVTQTDWQDYLDRVIPQGLFSVWHGPSACAVGTAGAIHNPRGGRYYFPFGGELALLVVHPRHRGAGLGAALCLSVLQRLREAGYSSIWTGVQGFRLSAVKLYLRLGFRPLLHQAKLAERWQRICTQIAWPYEPDCWPSAVPGGTNL